MIVLCEEYHHPNQATRVQLAVFEQPDGGGYLITELRLGSTKVTRTLGAVATREAALELVHLRAESLMRQRWEKVPATAA
jgi:hypothetical protein